MATPRRSRDCVFIFGIFAALAEFERELTRERTLAGLTAARARGRHGGRPFALSKAQGTCAQRSSMKVARWADDGRTSRHYRHNSP